MATCLVSELGPLATLSKCAGSATKLASLGQLGRSRGVRRRVRPLSTSSSSNDAVTAHHRALTAVHKAKALLPKALPSEGISSTPAQSCEYWDDLLSSTRSSLTSSAEEPAAKARIVVHGLDKTSGAEELVAALLEDPFASDAAQHAALKDRWNLDNNSQSLVIEYGVTETADDIVRSPSPWLRQYPTPVQLTELSTSMPPHLASKSLLTADIPIVVCNPLTHPLPSFFADTLPHTLHLNPHAIVVLTSGADTTAVRAYVDALLAHSGPPPPRGSPPNVPRLHLVFVDPARALSAVETLRKNPASPSIVQRYQDDFLGSRLPALSDAVAAILAPNGSSTTAPAAIAALRLNTALSLLRGALGACRLALAEANRELDRAYTGIDTLRGEISEADAKVHRRVLGVVDPASTSSNAKAATGDRVGEALRAAEAQVRRTIDRLVWWKLLYKVDEIEYIVSSAVESAWCKDLEKELILHTGRLSALQSTFTTSASTLLRAFPAPSPLHSPVLQNTLAQLRSRPSFLLSPNALTAPLHARRLQLAHPTARLHAAAQRTVLTLGGGALAGGALGGAGWAGVLTSGPLAGLAGGAEMGGGTALGLGLLGALAGARWAVGRWERAKRKWWEDWARVGEGLRRDLSSNLDLTMRRHVTLVPEKACSELEMVVVRRRREIDEVRDEVEALEGELRSIDCATKP